MSNVNKEIDWSQAPEWATFHAEDGKLQFWCNDERYMHHGGTYGGWEGPFSDDGYATYAKWELENIQYRPVATTPRPHAELIKQWADDEDCVVEYYSEGLSKWMPASTPAWDTGHKYRIKTKTPSIKTELLEQIAKMEQDLAEMKAKANQVG